jgi:hypothetical protein
MTAVIAHAHRACGEGRVPSQRLAQPRHCEPASLDVGEAIQGVFTIQLPWIASSLTLLAMTAFSNPAGLSPSPEHDATRMKQ